MKLLSLMGTLFLLSGCVSLNTVSLTSLPSERQKMIEAKVEKTIILGFNFDNDFVDELPQKLKSQCPNGQIQGVLTKDENINYFLFFVWKKSVSAQAYCVMGKG